jgi:hypothetical protein
LIDPAGPDIVTEALAPTSGLADAEMGGMTVTLIGARVGPVSPKPLQRKDN